VSHSSRSTGRKFQRQQRKLASVAAQMPARRQGNWIRPGRPAPGKDHYTPDVALVALSRPAGAFLPRRAGLAFEGYTKTKEPML
jgi:hypothetical protein